MMMNTLIDGKAIAAGIKAKIASEVKAMLDAGEAPPHLAAVLVGEDPASQSYIRSKEKACREVGFLSSVYTLPADTSEKELLEVIHFLNNDGGVDGFIVQLPLPEGLEVQKVIEAIDYKKDVDGFHPVNVGRMVQGQQAYLPATPFGIQLMLDKAGIETSGKHCVVLGRSNIVGTPASILLSRKGPQGDATVTICHSRTENLPEITRQADILIAAIGKPHFVTADMVKEGAVVIDVGIHRMPSDKTASGFRLTGDVDFEEVSRKASRISPVPGGVGVMTVVGLLQNTLMAAKGAIYAHH
jgi:methylenetetrahydrofolate dehydrogenase (NADP+)/methenyltetrahydrofolate cyclohydrolase